MLDTREIVTSLWEIKSEILPKVTWKRIYEDDKSNELSIKNIEEMEQSHKKEINEPLPTEMTTEPYREAKTPVVNRENIPNTLMRQLTIKPPVNANIPEFNNITKEHETKVAQDEIDQHVSEIIEESKIKFYNYRGKFQFNRTKSSYR